MADERLTETVRPDGTVERTHEVDQHDRVVVERRSGGGGLLALVALLALAVAAYFLFVNNRSETRRDNAIAGAAKDVGTAAKKAGAAVEDAAKDVSR